MTPNSNHRGPRAAVWSLRSAPGLLCALLFALISWAASAQQADLEVTKSVNNATPNVGDAVTFTVTVTNTGPDSATNVTLTDLLPAAGLNFVSATPSQGSYASGTGLWTIGTIITGASQTLMLQATVISPNATTNTATIVHADQSDPNPANNFANAIVTPQRADLAVTKSVSNATPNVGDTITFTVTVSNLGPDGATGVQLTDLLPAGLGFVTAFPSQGSYNSGTGLWTIGAISMVTPQTLTLQATVVSPNAATNTAAITHADQFDPITSNNSASAAITAPEIVAVPIMDMRWMFVLMGLILLATPFVWRR